MAITADGKRAYVTDFLDGGGDTVSVITTATGAVSAPITVGKAPAGVAITPDGKHAYVANGGDGTVSVITTATGAVSAPITVGKAPAGVAICPARERPPTLMTPRYTNSDYGRGRSIGNQIPRESGGSMFGRT